MLHDLIIAIGGTVGLMVAWVAVQSLKRRSDPTFAAGDDVLACGDCTGGSCNGCSGFRAAADAVAHKE
ncbi:MAG TPA: hypothetical protein VFX92_12045 [Candidatus Krumholzibacteria bacterium]|nr:hypothetical protein [Candidatus Krumholzibacteria bacterium]